LLTTFSGSNRNQHVSGIGSAMSGRSMRKLQPRGRGIRGTTTVIATGEPGGNMRARRSQASAGILSISTFAPASEIRPPPGRFFCRADASFPFSRDQIRTNIPERCLRRAPHPAQESPMIPNRRAGFSLGRSRQPIADYRFCTAGGNEDIVAGLHLGLHCLAARLGRTAAHANIFAEYARSDHNCRPALIGSASQLPSQFVPEMVG
jgi:hypothetical protein